MNRDRALELLHQHVTNQNLIKHMLASEAIIRALAKKLEKNEDEWGLIGLLHDLDFEQTKNDPAKHGLVTAELLAKEGFTEEQLNAIKSHNTEHTGVQRKTNFDFALTCAEQLTGLIVACALVQPDKKLAAVTVESIMKKFKQKTFAAGCSREDIQLCKKLDIPLEQFVELGLKAMREISNELGL
jgi:putative nucleotidyltransferase with HDIG domain